MSIFYEPPGPTRECFTCDRVGCPGCGHPTSEPTGSTSVTKPDPRILQIAIRRQMIAHENDNRTPRWDQLPAEERERMLAESAAWLRAAVETGIAPMLERPTGKHDAVWVDDEGFLWGEYQTSPPTPLAEAAILRLVWDREECSSKSELEEQGVQFRLIGWSL